MRKNQQGVGNPSKTTGAAASNQPKDTSQSSMPMTGNLTAPASLTQTSTSTAQMVGFSQAAAEHQTLAATTTTVPASSFLQQATDHLTPHHASHLTSNQNLTQIGLPSPMGLGAAVGGNSATTAVAIGNNASFLSNQDMAAFGQIVSNNNNNQDRSGSAGQLSVKQIEQIGKELEQCATHGDADEMQEILARHQDVIHKKALNVALRAAVKGCTTPKLEYSIQCCQLLIEAGANINSEEANEGKTALMMSCEKGYLELVKNLLDNEALIDHKDQQKRTSLMYAIGANAQNEDVVQELLNRGADVNDQTLTGLTPLLLAVKKSHSRICKLLLGRGADIKAQYPEDLNSSLHYACLQGNMFTLNTLLEHSRQKLSDQLTREFLYLLNKKQQTALEIANEKHTANPDNSTFEQIYSEMSQLYQQEDKAVDDVIETLLKPSTSTENTMAAAQQVNSNTAQTNASNQQQQQTSAVSGKRQTGNNRAKKAASTYLNSSAAVVDAASQAKGPQNRKQSSSIPNNSSSTKKTTNKSSPSKEDERIASESDEDQVVESQSHQTPAASKTIPPKTQEPSEHQNKIENSNATAMASNQKPAGKSNNNMPTTKSTSKQQQAQSSISKKAKKQSSGKNSSQIMPDKAFAEAVQDAYNKSNAAALNTQQINDQPCSMSDEDEFKSAESKTPPSQKANESSVVTAGSQPQFQISDLPSAQQAKNHNLIGQEDGGSEQDNNDDEDDHEVDGEDNDDTVTENSSNEQDEDEDSFVTIDNDTITGSNTTMMPQSNTAASSASNKDICALKIHKTSPKANNNIVSTVVKGQQQALQNSQCATKQGAHSSGVNTAGNKSQSQQKNNNNNKVQQQSQGKKDTALSTTSQGGSRMVQTSASNSSMNNKKQQAKENSKQSTSQSTKGNNINNKSNGEQQNRGSGAHQKTSATNQQSSQKDSTSLLPPWMQQQPGKTGSTQKQSSSSSHSAKQSQQVAASSAATSGNNPSPASSQGAVQKPIVNQHQQHQAEQTASASAATQNDDELNSWPQVLIQKLSASNSTATPNELQSNQNNNQSSGSSPRTHKKSSSSKKQSTTTASQSQQLSSSHNKTSNSSNTNSTSNRKQNAAVVENLKPTGSYNSANSNNNTNNNSSTSNKKDLNNKLSSVEEERKLDLEDQVEEAEAQQQNNNINIMDNSNSAQQNLQQKNESLNTASDSQQMSQKKTNGNSSNSLQMQSQQEASTNASAATTSTQAIESNLGDQTPSQNSNSNTAPVGGIGLSTSTQPQTSTQPHSYGQQSLATVMTSGTSAFQAPPPSHATGGLSASSAAANPYHYQQVPGAAQFTTSSAALNFGGSHQTNRTMPGVGQEFQAFFGASGGAAAPLTSAGIGAVGYGTIGASGHNAVAAGAAGGISQGAKQPGSAPITLFKSLESRKTQLDFILEQQEIRNKILTYQLHMQQERMREIDQDVKLRKQDHIVRVNEYYNQAQRYYENFRQLENEMNNLADDNELTLSQSINLLNQLKDATKGMDSSTSASATQRQDEVQSLIRQIQENLCKVEQTHKKFTDEIDFRKEDEKSYMQTQSDKRKEEEKDMKEQTDLQADMALMKETQATKQLVAKTQIQYNNLFIEMENAFGEESEQSLYQQCSRYPQQVFNKLHDEVILFDESVKSIMDEIEPIKTIIIEKIHSFIKQVIPNGDVEVYGSHATKLCLHWSDIDLVLKPAAPKDRDASGLGDGRSDDPLQPHNIFPQSQQQRDGLHGSAYSSSNATNMRNWLNILYTELIKSENRGWLQKVDFIENTTVPVIKLACNYQYLSNNGSGQLLLPNGQVPRYPAIVCKPINVDITLWTENHNGLPCVNLVRLYLAESQLIEPLILVLKQMLKVWGFNDAYTGGLSSYALFLMIVSFLQEKRKPALKSEVNLGETLLELIRYYAQLDFSQYAICCKMPGEQSDKQNLYQNINTDYNFFMQPRVVIDDPLMASNNVGKSAFRFQEIKNIMSHAYNSVFTGCFCSCHVKTMCRNTNYHQNPQTYHKSQLVAQFGAYHGQYVPQAPHFLNFQHPPAQSNYNNAFGMPVGTFIQNQQQSTLILQGGTQPQVPLSSKSSSKQPQLVTTEGGESSHSGAPANQTSNTTSDSNSVAVDSSNSIVEQQQPSQSSTSTSATGSQQPQTTNNTSNQINHNSQTVIGTATTNDNQQNNAARAPYPADEAPQLRTQSQPFQLTNAVTWQGQNQFYNQNILSSQQVNSDNDSNCSCDSILSRLIYGYNNYRRTMESLHPNFGALQMGNTPGVHHGVSGMGSMVGGPGGFGLPGMSGMPPFLGGQNL